MIIVRIFWKSPFIIILYGLQVKCLMTTQEERLLDLGIKTCHNEIPKPISTARRLLRQVCITVAMPSCTALAEVSVQTRSLCVRTSHPGDCYQSHLLSGPGSRPDQFSLGVQRGEAVDPQPVRLRPRLCAPLGKLPSWAALPFDHLHGGQRAEAWVCEAGQFFYCVVMYVLI